jgi:hypothetical protein
VPEIVSEPEGGTAVLGQKVVMKVVATSPFAMSYVWKKNGVTISGATGSTYTVSAFAAGNAGTYTVEVTNKVGKTVSGGAYWSVIMPPVMVVQPTANVTWLVGARGILSVSASGDGELSYQWKKNGVAIDGAIGPMLDVAEVTMGDAGNYTVEVRNVGGVVTSGIGKVSVVVGSKPVFTTQPVAKTCIEGQSVSLSVAATGVPGVAYMWKMDGVYLWCSQWRRRRCCMGRIWC